MAGRNPIVVYFKFPAVKGWVLSVRPDTPPGAPCKPRTFRTVPDARAYGKSRCKPGLLIPASAWQVRRGGQVVEEGKR